MLGNIFPCFQPLQRLLREAVSGVRNINVDILFFAAVLRVNRHGNQRNRLQRQGMFCRILYKHLNQKREDYRVFHFFMDFKIIGEFFRIAQQQNFEVIFAVIRLRRHRHHLACIAENIGEIIGRNTAHRFCMVVLTEVNHAVNKVQTVHVKMRTNLDFQVIHLDFLFFQLLLIQRDLQTSDLMNHVSEFIVNLLQLYQISFRHLIEEIPIVIFLKIFRKHSDRLQDSCFQMEQQHGTGHHHQKCNA